MSYTRPTSVPRLNLNTLADNLPTQAEPQTTIEPHKPSLMSPTSRSAVSWGTPLSSPYHVSKQDILYGNTAHRPCKHLQHPQDKKDVAVVNPLENKNPTKTVTIKNDSTDGKKNESERKGEMQNQHTAAKKDAYWYLDDELRDTPSTPKSTNSGPTIDEMAQMQAGYTSQPYSDIHSARKFAAEDDSAQKQRAEVMNQVLSDQLCKHVISDPEQDRDPLRANPADPLRQQTGTHMAPLRYKSRRLHETKVSTAGAATETNLQQRVTFFARILTQNGRDALRELFGFLFQHDGSITLYEFRMFGKRNIKALPLIQRAVYRHQVGRKRGSEITTADIIEQRNLAFDTSKQVNLPDSLKKHKLLTVRITEVCDGPASTNKWDMESSDRDMNNDDKVLRNDMKVLKKVQGLIRDQLRKQSVSKLMGLGRLFRALDASGDGLLSKEELLQALERFGISISQEDFMSVWRVVDENDDGAIDYGEFMRAFIGEMSEFRKSLVRKVFKKLDPHKTGSANILDLKKLYSAKKHPLVISGQFSQSEMESRFVEFFRDGWSRDEVSYVVFEEYYEGLSICITSDNDFANMMRNCWGV